MTQNFPKLTTMTEARKNSTETTTFSKLSARKRSKVGVSAKANTPKRRFRSQKICDAEIEVSAEEEVPLSRKLQNLSQCDRALMKLLKASDRLLQVLKKSLRQRRFAACSRSGCARLIWISWISWIMDFLDFLDYMDFCRIKEMLTAKVASGSRIIPS